jgi:hypothetical protein
MDAKKDFCKQNQNCESVKKKEVRSKTFFRFKRHNRWKKSLKLMPHNRGHNQIPFTKKQLSVDNPSNFGFHALEWLGNDLHSAPILSQPPKVQAPEKRISITSELQEGL